MRDDAAATEDRLCRRIRRISGSEPTLDWTLRADNHNHHHGVVRLVESPVELKFSWRPDIGGPVRLVGVFRLDLQGLLAHGYIRTEGHPREQTVRLRIVRSEEGTFWIQSRGDAPRLRVPDARGSLRWIREAVNRHPDILEASLRSTIRLAATERIEWCSPLAVDGFVECRDVEALGRVKAPELSVPLSDFWPERGPVWDALGRTSSGTLLFVEAKAHVRELVSGATRAMSDSRGRIEAALTEAREFLAPDSHTPWSEVFYQYANRLAFLYFLRQKTGSTPTWCW